MRKCGTKEVWKMNATNLWRMIALLTALAATPVAAQGQTPKEARNALSVEVAIPIAVPIGLLVYRGSEGMMAVIPIQVQFQRVVADHLVLLVKAGLNYSWGVPRRGPGGDLDIYPEVELDWHPFHRGLGGPYVGLAGFSDYSVTLGDPAAAAAVPPHSYHFRLGATIGCQFLLPAGITTDLAFGLGYGPSLKIDSSGTKTWGAEFDVTRVGLYVGMRF
jgi:hypothetical protein